MMYNTKALQKLQQALLEKSGVEVKSPFSCKDISIAVFISTRNYVSETTIKRVFGLLPYRLYPSPAVMDILSAYVGFRNWQQLESLFNKNGSNSTLFTSA